MKVKIHLLMWWILFYFMTAAHLQEVLVQGVGLQPGAVSRPTADLLSVLEATAEVLKLKDTSLGR